jgi:hypothetical protein
MALERRHVANPVSLVTSRGVFGPMRTNTLARPASSDAVPVTSIRSASSTVPSLGVSIESSGGSSFGSGPSGSESPIAPLAPPSFSSGRG